MNRIIRYWNQNRKKIIITIAIIAFIFLLIQALNYLAKNNQENEKNETVITSNKPTQSVITGEKISEKVTDSNTSIIQSFIDLCNNQKHQEALELLTDDCKEVIFNNDVNLFINNYWKNIFQTKKTYEIELWLRENYTYMYKVKYYEDNLLATGGSQISNNTEDYITVITKNDEEKIAINGFVKKEEINKSEKLQDIEIIINSKEIYKNYETYHITINNYTSKNILINDGQNNKNIVLIDNNNVEYTSFIHEIPESSLTLQAGYQKNIEIRFNKLYNIDREIKKIEFKSIISDSERYYQTPENAEKISISIEM